MYTRQIYQDIEKNLNKGKVIILLGARQVGKTTLVKEISKHYEATAILELNGDDNDTQLILQDASTAKLKKLLHNIKLLVIDEAQQIDHIGQKLKLIVDHINNVQVIATGSSSFELKNKLNEPLTGRKIVYYLYPLSIQEIVNKHGYFYESTHVEHRLVYGSYPAVAMELNDPKKVLQELCDSYLYKDLFMWGGLKKPEKIITLLKALAYQVGNTVSYLELGQLVQLDKLTIEKYIDVLEQCYVIFKLNSYSNNLRNELKKSKKIYFFDNGIRNALIGDLRPIALRQDTGALWENYIVSEQVKKMKYFDVFQNIYFWRTSTQQEIDIVYEQNTQIHALEIKWNDNAKTKFNVEFLKAYKPVQTKIIHQKNYLDHFIDIN